VRPGRAGRRHGGAGGATHGGAGHVHPSRDEAGHAANGRPPTPEAGPGPAAGHSTSSMTLKIGMYSAMTIDPTMPPRTPIISGSISAVSDSVVDSTCWS
jgi:hypothetical protein